MPTLFFEAREQALLGGDYERVYTPTGEVHRGLTVNPMRLPWSRARQALAEAGLAVEPSPFCRGSYRLLDADVRPGLHPYHHAGVYYVQEPSAAAPAALLDVKPGEYVLDLCAAPGGKTSQLAAALDGQGLIVANEYSAPRAAVLKGNLERMGIANAVVLNESTGRIAGALPEVFDKVLVDAPCSGEGMFRKESEAERQHSPALVAQCAALGRQILDDAAVCVKPGGLLCYSTCTFSPEEDEGQISAFLDRHPEFSLVDLSMAAAFGSAGEPQRCQDSRWPLQYAKRIYPCHGGEGHFMALLRKEGAGAGARQPAWQGGRCPKECTAFFKEYFPALADGAFLAVGETLYRMPEAPVPAGLKKLHILRVGTEAGSMVKGRFEPAHGLYMAFGARCGNRESLELGDARTAAWLRGEEIEACTADKGFAAVLCGGYPLGFGKCSGGKVKNRYPKGLRNWK